MFFSSGCGVHPPPSTTFTFSFKVLGEQPATSPIDAASIVDLENADFTYVTIDEDGYRGDLSPVHVTPTIEHGAEFAVAESDRRVEFLKRGKDGSIALTAVIEHKENALTLFEPPLVIAPASLNPGATFTSEASMRVVALDDYSKQRERGTCSRRITYANDATLLLAAGAFAVARVDVRFEADLRLADAEESTTMYVSRGEPPGIPSNTTRGVMLQHSIEKITILGAFPRTTRRTLVREQ